MSFNEHIFAVTVTWDGPNPNRAGAPARRSHSRTHTITADGPGEILGSAARVFHGDVDRWNPEQLLISAVAQCHMMTFLYLAQQAGLAVVEYTGPAAGVLTIDLDGIGGEFSSITLSPSVVILSNTDALQVEATVAEIHNKVEQYCFIARSVRAPIMVHPTTTVIASEQK